MERQRHCCYCRLCDRLHAPFSDIFVFPSEHSSLAYSLIISNIFYVVAIAACERAFISVIHNTPPQYILAKKIHNCTASRVNTIRIIVAYYCANYQLHNTIYCCIFARIQTNFTNIADDDHLETTEKLN